jgi:ubiquinone/menaquinone biosynthesis C-methylase UbiE
MNEQTSDRIHDALADSYVYATDLDTSGRLKVDLMRQYVRPTDDVLDVGAANGLHMRVVAPLCARVTGIDINERMLERARERLSQDGIENAELVRASATELPFDDRSFDVVYSYSTLILVPGMHEALDEIARVLRPWGVALLDITGRWNLSQRHWRRWYRSQGHDTLNALTWPQTRQALANRGLEVEEDHATGVSDQWKYLRGAHRLKRFEAMLHGDSERDLDYRLSNLPVVRRAANRWFIAARKVR